jgi:hypothetical protein
MALLVAVLTQLAPVSPPSAAAQELPACDRSRPPSRCQLPGWPESAQSEAPSPFGRVGGRVWVTDEVDDVGPGGFDIQAVGIGSADISDARALRRDDAVLRRGRRDRAVRPGENVLVRIVIDRPLDEVAEGHAGIHVATDIDGSRRNNAPAGVGSRPQPFAGAQDVYTIARTTTTGRTQLLDSDLARGWYRDRDAFAAAWAAPNVLDVLIRPEGLGADLRVVTFASAQDGGYDSVDLGVAGIPVDGRVGLRPLCLEAAITAEPYTVRRLVENDQMLRNVEARASWLGGGAFALDAESRASLDALIAAADDDGDGRVELPSFVDLFEDGGAIGQRPGLMLALDGDTAQLALQLGLTRRGFDVVRQITPEATGDAALDAWLAEASESLAEAMPPFRVGRRGGQLVGAVPGSCLTELADPPSPEPSASDAPAESTPSDGLADATASDAPADASSNEAPEPGTNDDTAGERTRSDASPSSESQAGVVGDPANAHMAVDAVPG